MLIENASPALNKMGMLFWLKIGIDIVIALTLKNIKIKV